MELVALVLSVAALAVALVAWTRAGSAHVVGSEAHTAARRHAANTEQSVGSELAVLRALLERLVGGHPVTPQMVREGQLWRDVTADEARRLIEGGTVAVVDVRTPQETASGTLPGARRIPMDQIEEREDEIPRSGTVLVYCAGGGRSAAVCEALSQRGFGALLNLEGGIGAWTGPLERRD